MALMKGRAVLIKVNVGSEESPEWKAVCGQQGGSLERSVETIETSDKDSENRELLGTYLTWTVSCDGLYKTEDDGFSALETAFNAKIRNGRFHIPRLGIDQRNEFRGWS